MYKKIEFYLQENKDIVRDKIIDWQRHLVRLKAIGPENGGNGERDKSLYIKSILKKYKGKITEYNIEDTRVSAGVRDNFVFITKESESRVCIITHTDVVPEGEISLWDSNPFVLRVEDDMLYGRGVLDNHSAIVSSLLLLDTLNELNIDVKPAIAIYFFADEEVGSVKGIKAVVDKYNPFKKEDIVYVPDMNTINGDVLEIAEKNLLWLEISFTGKQSHGSRPDIGINAHAIAAQFVSRMEAIKKEKFDDEDLLFDYPKTSIEPTKGFSNVQNVNTIPGEYNLSYDCRILPSHSLDDVIGEFECLAKEIEKEYDISVKIEILLKDKSLPRISENSPAVKYFKNAMKTMGKEAILRGVGGATCAYHIRKKGIDAVCMGKGPFAAHMPNESISINDIVEMCLQYVAIIQSLESESDC